MLSYKFPAAILALALVTQAHADFRLPTCDAVAAWAADFSADSFSQVTAAVRLPKQFRDDALVPLFGLPIMQWRPPRFSAADTHLGRCVAAREGQGDSAARAQVQGLRRELVAAQTPVRRIGLARDKVAASVAKLLAAIDGSPQRGILDQALAALRGVDVRRGLGAIPRDPARAIAVIVEQYPYLLPSDAEKLGKGLLQRREQLEQQAREAEIKALAALEQARAELDATDVSAEGLAVLDRLQRHPALAVVQVDDARRFVDEVKARRESIRVELRRQRLQAALAELEQARKRLAALPLTADSLAELDRLAALPALRELPATSVHDFRRQLDQQRRAIDVEVQREWLRRVAADLAGIRAELAALPLDEAGRVATERLAQHPVLGKVSREQAQAFYRELRAKQAEIAAAERQRKLAEERRLADQALLELDQTPGGGFSDALDGLGAFWQASAQVARDMEREIGVTAAQRYWRGIKSRFAERADAMLPVFRNALSAISADQDGIPRLRTAAADLTGMPDPDHLPAGYNQAVLERGAEILTALQAQVCEKRWRAMGLDADEAAQSLWADGRATTLGEFLCRLMDAGHQVLSYQSPYPLFSTHSLKLMLKPGGVQTLLLHEADLGSGRAMLVGYRIDVGNQQHELSLPDWEQTAAGLLPTRTDGDPCVQLMKKAAGELSEMENITLMGCMLR